MVSVIIVRFRNKNVMVFKQSIKQLNIQIAGEKINDRCVFSFFFKVLEVCVVIVDSTHLSSSQSHQISPR